MVTPFRVVRPRAKFQPSVFRETALTSRDTSLDNTYTRVATRYADGTKAVTYGYGVTSMLYDGFLADYYETRVLQKFFQPIPNGSFFFSDSAHIATGLMPSRAMFEFWLLATDFDITTFDWDNQPTVDQTSDLRLFGHLVNSATFAGAGAGNIKWPWGPLWKVVGNAPMYYALYTRIVLKYTSGPQDFNGFGMSPGGLFILTDADRTTHPVTQRKSSSTTRTLTLGVNHPIKFGMQIEVRNVDDEATLPKKYDTVTDTSNALFATTNQFNMKKQVLVTAVTATTINYESNEGTLTESTTATPVNAVVLYN